MQKIIGFLFLLLSLPSISIADPILRRQLAEELLLLNNAKEQSEQMIVQMKQMIDSQLIALDLSQKDKQNIEEIEKITTDILFADLSWESMKDEYIDIYASTFDEEELKGIIRFAKSPIGQKLNEKMPILMQKSMAIGQQRAQKVMPEVQAAIQGFIERKHLNP